MQANNQSCMQAVTGQASPEMSFEIVHFFPTFSGRAMRKDIIQIIFQRGFQVSSTEDCYLSTLQHAFTPEKPFLTPFSILIFLNNL